MQPIITVENLSKAYRIGMVDEIHDTVMGAAKSIVTAPFKNLRNLQRLNTDSDHHHQDTLWALRDVCFEVNEGDVVGIIGRNGAGKSTLLKILSRITEPTSGRAVIRGRVSSLLEVGTGFHPELTGRENIYMNGTILGMTKREIDRKFAEIVDFSGVEKFLDTPTKRYSSGMQIRLGFAVAAHLEPEVMIVDEVLAVGDAEFQKKCIGKMHDVAESGRTVLFVSHNMGLLQQICQKGVLLVDGSVALAGTLRETIQLYLETLNRSSQGDLSKRTDRRGAGGIRVNRIDIFTEVGHPPGMLETGKPANFCFHLDRALPRTDVSFVIHDAKGVEVTAFHTKRRAPHDDLEQTSQVVTCSIDELPLLSGRYSLAVSIWSNGQIQDRVDSAIQFDVENGLFHGRSFANPSVIPGSVCIPHRWIAVAEPSAVAADHS